MPTYKDIKRLVLSTTKKRCFRGTTDVHYNKEILNLEWINPVSSKFQIHKKVTTLVNKS